MRSPARHRTFLAFLMLMTAGAVALAALVPPPAFAQITPAPGSIIVVRAVGNQDTLWSIDPSTAAATELVTLPFRTSWVEASPAARRLAFLTLSYDRKPEVCIYDSSSGALSTWSLAAHGLWAVDSFTWLSSRKLLIAGRATGNRYLLTDRLYSLNVENGAFHHYAGLAGTDPSASPAAHRLVFVQLTDGGRVSAASTAHWIVERLYRLRLADGAKPVLIASSRCSTKYFARAFLGARLSPDGAYVVSFDEGVGIAGRYVVRSAGSGKVLASFARRLWGTEEMAWSTHDEVAFWGSSLTTSNATMRVAVYSVTTESLTQSALMDNGVSSFAWSPDGTRLAVGLIQSGGPTERPGRSELWLFDPITLAAPTDLGAGGGPIFVPGT